MQDPITTTLGEATVTAREMAMAREMGAVEVIGAAVAVAETAKAVEEELTVRGSPSSTSTQWPGNSPVVDGYVQ